MKKILVTFLLMLGLFSLQAQPMSYKGFPSLVWPKLYNITYQKATDAQGEYDRPIFSNAVKTLKGKEVTLPGYIVPFENGMNGKHFILSSLPLNACFFCGVGGPETVVEVYLNEPLKYTDKPVEIRGTLKLNDTVPDNMIYILEKGDFVGEIGF